jgi:hypothetical protein
MIQILDTIVIVLFVLFLIYIFRGYHLSRLEKEEQKEKNGSTTPCSGSDIDSCGDGGE